MNHILFGETDSVTVAMSESGDQPVLLLLPERENRLVDKIVQDMRGSPVYCDYLEFFTRGHRIRSGEHC